MHRIEERHPLLIPQLSLPLVGCRLDVIILPLESPDPPPEQEHWARENARYFPIAAGAIPRDTFHPDGSRKSRLDGFVVFVRRAGLDINPGERAVEDGFD